MASLNERTQGIKNFNVTTRIQDGLTSFSVDYLTPLKPDALVCGEYVDVTLYDIANPGETVVITGRIQKITRNNKDGNRIYSISGRDAGFQLVQNPYSLDCALTSNVTFNISEILENILEDEDITIGTGTPALDLTTEFHTNGNLTNGFCGIFRSKKEAIDYIFKLYTKSKGINQIRWYIDNENKLRWFEMNKTRGSIIQFETESQTELIDDFTIEENAENIVNQLTGYGCDDVTIKSTQQNTASIAQYGLWVGEDITDSSIKSQSEMAAIVREELNQKAWPIYTATLVLKKFYDVEVGQQIKFVDDPNYSNVIFTCTQKEISGNPADITTTLSFSTDKDAIAPPDETDVTRAIVKDALKNNQTSFGTVIDVSDEDCTNMLVRPYGKDTLVNAKSSNSCTNYNSAGLSDEEEEDGFVELMAG